MPARLCCRHCQRLFVSTRPGATFCSKACCNRHHGSLRPTGLHQVVCLYCQQSFSVPCRRKSKPRKFCSASCANRAQASARLAWRQPLCCQHCGKEFFACSLTSHPRRFCSLACSSQAARRLDHDRPCQRCGKAIGNPTDNGRFCSRDCYVGFVRSRPRPRHTCRQCGGEFTVRPGVVQTYCGRACQHEAQRQAGQARQPTWHCAGCGCTFRRPLCKAKRLSHGKYVRLHLYCSFDCFKRNRTSPEERTRRWLEKLAIALQRYSRTGSREAFRNLPPEALALVPAEFLGTTNSPSSSPT